MGGLMDEEAYLRALRRRDGERTRARLARLALGLLIVIGGPAYCIGQMTKPAARPAAVAATEQGPAASPYTTRAIDSAEAVSPILLEDILEGPTSRWRALSTDEQVLLMRTAKEWRRRVYGDQPGALFALTFADCMTRSAEVRPLAPMESSMQDCAE